MALQSDTQNMGCVITASVCPFYKRPRPMRGLNGVLGGGFVSL